MAHSDMQATYMQYWDKALTGIVERVTLTRAELHHLIIV